MHFFYCIYLSNHFFHSILHCTDTYYRFHICRCCYSLNWCYKTSLKMKRNGYLIQMRSIKKNAQIYLFLVFILLFLMQLKCNCHGQHCFLCFCFISLVGFSLTFWGIFCSYKSTREAHYNKSC